MTAKTLEQQIRKKYGISMAAHYFICLAMGIAGLIFLINILTKSPVVRQPPWFIYLVPAFFILFAINGCWRLARTFHIIQIDSTKTLEEKKMIITAWFESKKASGQVNDKSARFISTGNIFLDLTTTIYFDDKKILFNIHSVENGLFPGILDFGMSERARKKLRRYLEGYL